MLVLEWTDPPFSAGHWVPDHVSAGGGRPVMGNQGADSQRLDWDAVSTAVADVVIVAPCGYHLGPAYEHAAELVADRRLPDDADVWAVDADSYFVRPGPRLVDGAELVGQILHPSCAAPPTRRGLFALRLTEQARAIFPSDHALRIDDNHRPLGALPVRHRPGVGGHHVLGILGRCS